MDSQEEKEVKTLIGKKLISSLIPFRDEQFSK